MTSGVAPTQGIRMVFTLQNGVHWGGGSAWRGTDHENKCEEWNNTKSPRSHHPNACCLIVQPWVTTDRLQGDILKRRNCPGVGRTGNAACYKIVIGNRQHPLLGVKTQSAFVPWCSEERGTMKEVPALWQDRQMNSAAALTAGRQILYERKFSVCKFKLFGQWKWEIFIMFSRSRSSLFFSKISSYVSLVLKAFHNSLRHSFI